MKTNIDLLDQYFDFILSNQIKEEKIVWIYNSSYNYFYSAYILAKNGLKNQAQNCARMGLEFHWMALLLSFDKALLLSWCLGSASSKRGLKKLEELENTSLLIKKLGDKQKIKIKDRDNIYKALSDTSHVKFKNICFFDISHGQQGHILGGFQSDLDVANCVKAIDLCMKFVFTELSQYYKVDIKNEYKAEELHLISGGLSVSSDGKIVPDITSKGSIGSDGANAIALLEMIKNPEKFFGKK